MRVTSGMVRRNIIANMNSALGKLQISQTQIATGKRVFKPSDDPATIAKSVNIKALLRDSEQFKRNIEDGLGWLSTTEAAVDDMTEILTNLKEIAVKGAGDTLGADERAALGEQTEALIQRLLDSSNTAYGDRYVFAGTNTLTRPYSASSDVAGETFAVSGTDWTDLGNPRLESGTVLIRGPLGEVYTEGVDYTIDYDLGRIVKIDGGGMAEGVTYTAAYTADTTAAVQLNVAAADGAINREVAEGVREQVNIGGEELLSSSVDVFALMVRVKNALLRNDSDSVNLALDEIEGAADQVTSGLGRLGAMSEGLNLADARLDTEIVNLTALVSSLEDADVAEVAVSLQAEQVAYQAALAAAATILNTSLVNFIE
jgi:flagellar hook-associated protein 3 FlgL